MSDHTFTIAVSVNNEEVLHRNLLLSPGLLSGGNQLIIRREFTSASLAYNSAIAEAENDIVIFVHQDIYLPDTWFGDLTRCLAILERTEANWGVLGCYGSRKGAADGLGRVYTRGLGQHGRHLIRPEPVETLDEIILIIRKSSGLRFDPDLPSFHLYGSDICMTARQRGTVNYAFQGYCVHNTNQLLILPNDFYTCYRYMRRKWAHYLPIYTSCMKISLLNEEFYRRRIVEAKQRLLGMRSRPAKRVDDPRVFSKEPNSGCEVAGSPACAMDSAHD
jgi:Glycosyltransferase like family